MMTLSFPGLSTEGIQVMRDALAGVRHESEWSGALGAHEWVQRWWEGLRKALAQGVEGSQARALLSFQIALCGAVALSLQVVLDKAAAAPRSEDVDRARTALAEVREIEVKARNWLGFVTRPAAIPSDEKLVRGMAAHERGETEDLADVVARLKASRSS
jgi:hypothetical protein